MKLFISYRRSDSTHAAARVRMSLQMKFGADAVFIDREIPAGQKWEAYLEEMLQQCTGVVVLVGDEFLRRLRKNKGAADEAQDPLLWEISTALRLGKKVYPVLFGNIDMPDASKLPEPIRGLADFQAVFAREPAFDAAMGVLAKAVADDHRWVETELPAATAAGAELASPAAQGLAAWPWYALAAPLLLWWLGRMVLWLLDPVVAATRPLESAFWHGLRYALTTLVWGLGPYLAYWMVAELRARARLPIFNLHGLLSVLNVGGLLVSGGSFLLLSTLKGWHLVPLWVFPAQPGPMHYFLLALGLLGITLLAVLAALWEPQVRGWSPLARARGMQVIHVASLVAGACGVWFGLSLACSLPPLGGMDPVPVVGYLMLSPALSLLVAAWLHARALLGGRQDIWQLRTLFGLLLGLYGVCTLALFSLGPTRLLAAGY